MKGAGLAEEALGPYFYPPESWTLHSLWDPKLLEWKTKKPTSVTQTVQKISWKERKSRLVLLAIFTFSFPGYIFSNLAKPTKNRPREKRHGRSKDTCYFVRIKFNTKYKYKLLKKMQWSIALCSERNSLDKLLINQTKFFELVA